MPKAVARALNAFIVPLLSVDGDDDVGRLKKREGRLARPKPRALALGAVMEAVRAIAAADVEDDLSIHRPRSRSAGRSRAGSCRAAAAHCCRRDRRRRSALTRAIASRPTRRPSFADALARDERVEWSCLCEQETRPRLVKRSECDRRDRAAQRVARARSHEEPRKTRSSGDMPAGEGRLDRAHDARHLGLEPVEGLG